MSYGELHKHSGWSLLDGVGTAENGAQRAAELGHDWLVMTEHAVVSGVVHHIDACRDVGIMPLVGLEAYYRRRRITNVQVERMRKNGEDVESFFEYFHMVLIAKDVRGWRSLKLLSSEAFRSGYYRKPCIDDELLDRYHEGLIISTSCVSGYVPRAILRGDDAAIKQHCADLDRWVGEDWYFEGQPHAFEDLVIVNRECASLAQTMGRPFVITRDAHAPDETWVETQHVSVHMRRKGRMSEVDDTETSGKGDDADDAKYDLRIADTAYIASAAQTRADMLANHPGLGARTIDEAIANTGMIASRCTPWLMDRSPKLPRYRPDSTDEADYQELRRRVFAGLRQLGHDEDQRYVDAVEKELAIYRKRRVCAFFLITDDMIKWLRSNDGLPSCAWDANPVPTKTPEKVGLGRGSAGGCVTAYVLRITLINPITYKLSFERFLNPDRDGLPDIDIDLTSHGAELAKEWLKRTRGRDRVYDMIAHSTFGAREALRRVGMVYGVSHAQLSELTKRIDGDDSNTPLAALREAIPELARFAENHPRVFEHAARMQKNNSKITEHASAVVISEKPLEEIVPVMKKSAKDDYMVTAFGNSADKETISDLGLLKLDLLVVVALARQMYAEQLVARVHGVELNLDKLPTLEDPYAAERKVLDIFSRGIKTGIFQWDGKSNMASLTKRMQPEHIHHLAICNAGVRPGVSDSAEEMLRRRHGAEFEYWDPAVEPALAESYGLPVFQEQIMAVFQFLGGYSAAEADTVRRIMSKYYRIKGDVAAQMLGEHQQRFVDNASLVCRGGASVAKQIWAYCGSASAYLFNKSHAEEYSLIAYGDAYLKAHYPDAFYASLLTFPPAWVKKPENRGEFYSRIVREARSFDIDVLPPDVNESDNGFTIRGDAVRFGLTGIKGLGPAMVADVLANRPFTSIEDMGARLTACNAAGRGALAQAGAMDRFGARENLTPDERVAFEEDRIGVALSGEDKLVDVREGLRALIHTQDEFDVAANGQAMVVGGEVIGGKEVDTKRGPSLKLVVAFGADEYKVSIPPWDYNDRIRELIDSDVPILVRGAKDVEWDCVAVDEIVAATEVLSMMETRALEHESQKTITANGVTAPAAYVIYCYSSIEEARDAYARGEINVEELERQLASLVAQEVTA